MTLVVNARGEVRAVYAELIDLAVLGHPTINRASRVEPDVDGCWYADLRPVSGPVLGPYSLRSDALAAEVDWLESHWLTRPADPPQR